MKFLRNIAKAIIGLLMLIGYHLPRLIFLGLRLSYSAVFNNSSYMTADVKEHLKRARKILRRGLNAELLYAAVELRFAVERMIQHDTWLANDTSMRIKKNSDPVKQLKTMQSIDENSKYAHDLIWRNKETGDVMKWGEYKPLDLDRVNQIKGRLGDMLHPGTGPRTGFAGNEWTYKMKSFLLESIEYIEDVYSDRTPFFLYEEIEQIELVRKPE